eukprot:TRINITY_DN2384_c1_g2_i7.p1 TRINITY_DN2384_c1_g2~~TRINITY_DN2384_c1_g2_i7.p1  ORF type:complete len:178 (+),score=23.14 TRINITY_DN2384_c1_g2_i7:320-853(+)
MSLLSLARQSSALQVLTQVRVRAAVVSRVISHRAHQHTTSTSNNSSSSSSNSITPSIVDKKSSASSMMNSPLSFVHVRSLTSEAKCHNDRVTFDFRKEHDGKLLRVVMESEGNNVFTTTNLASLNTRLTRELKNPQVCTPVYWLPVLYDNVLCLSLRSLSLSLPGGYELSRHITRLV